MSVRPLVPALLVSVQNRAGNRTQQSAYVGGGLRYYLTRRFFLRGEFKEHIIFTNRNQNQQVDEWKFGFAFFF